jgi:hypothetical protein
VDGTVVGATVGSVGAAEGLAVGAAVGGFCGWISAMIERVTLLAPIEKLPVTAKQRTEYVMAAFVPGACRNVMDAIAGSPALGVLM